MRNIIIAAVAGLLFSSNAFADLDGVLIKLKPDDPAVVAMGAGVYDDTCAACHGANLEGEENWKEYKDDDTLPAPPHDDTGHTWHHADDLLFEITKFGINKIMSDEEYVTEMPPYEGVLDDVEIIAVLSYIKSTWSERTTGWHNSVNEAFNKDWQPTENPPENPLVGKDALQGKSMPLMEGAENGETPKAE